MAATFQRMEIVLRAPVKRRTFDWARVRVPLTYIWGHGRLPDLQHARRFTELVQLRKLHDRDARLPLRLDKVLSKEVVAAELGAEWCVPTLWHGATLPEAPFASHPMMVKARHGCNQYLPFMPGGDWKALRRRSAGWTAKPYGGWLDEWGYRDVARGVLAEPLLGGDPRRLPLDYKIYVFGGVATHVQVHLDRAGNHRWELHDRDWASLVPVRTNNIAAPRSLKAMLDGAETLAKGFSFARIDCYELDGRPLFGEFSFYPGSGLDPFAADWIDFELGALWHAALAS